jgi:hypothetical protein
MFPKKAFIKAKKNQPFIYHVSVGYQYGLD